MSTRTAPIRLLIVDDHPVVRAGLRGMLAEQSAFQIVGEASDGATALELVAQQHPDVILMDLRMVGMNGVTATQRLRDQYQAVHVLVLTTYDSDTDILRAIEAGATGYLLKDTPRDDLFQAIHAAARGDTVLTPSVANRLLTQLRTPASDLLSGREIEVLEQVARGASNKDIARSLRISEATVKSHLIHIYEKLGVADRTAAVTQALERGIIRLNTTTGE